jgi:hypothetical protein
MTIKINSIITLKNNERYKILKEVIYEKESYYLSVKMDGNAIVANEMIVITIEKVDEKQYVTIIEDKTVLYPESGISRRIRKKNAFRRKLLCEGLDDLVKHYMPEFKRVRIQGFSKVRVI